VTDLAGEFGPEFIRSVALTGGDDDYDLGTDVVILFEVRDPKTFEDRLVRQVVLNAGNDKGVKSDRGEISGMAYRSWRNDDRTVSSYVAAIGGAVVVTNSLAALRNIVEVFQKKRRSLADLDEYRFFRRRYAPGEAGETAFLIQSAATLRRINGPRWIIARSRRIRDLAVLSDLQAEHLKELATGAAESVVLRPELPLSTSGEVEVAGAAVRNASVGSPRFMTPVIELEIDRVTRSEADAYERWQAKHKGHAGDGLDSIACRLRADDGGLAVDASLRARVDPGKASEYLDIFKGVKLGPASGDPHGAVLHAALAFNPQAKPLRRLFAAVRGFVPQFTFDPFEWIGPSIAFYADESPLWDEFANFGSDAEREQFAMQNAWRLPVAVNIEVASALKATAFLAALRTFVEQETPGVTTWETVTYGEHSYVKIGLKNNPQLAPEIAAKAAVYYVLTAESLTVSLNEETITSVLDRLADREAKAAKSQNQANAGTGTWLGETFNLDLRAVPFRELISLVNREHGKDAAKLSWGNLPILNEWKRLFPNEDPVALHKRLWGVELVCPGGGKYVWNAKRHTMESTVYGHPGEPKEAGVTPPQIRGIRGFAFGLTLENQGLRVRAELERGP
jgi:hypothetical protein